MDQSSLTVDSIVLGSRDWAWVALILAAAVIALSIWSYASRSRLSGLRFLAMALKVAAVVALAFCLLEPMRRTERPLPGANVMAVVVDNSRSMEIRPPGATESRVAQVLDELKSSSPWQARLAQDFDLRRYAFDDRLRAIEDLDQLPFDGNNSSVADAVETLTERFSSRPVAGMLLFSDGLATDDLAGFVEREELPFPIYPVTYGEQSKLQDVSISDTSLTMSSFELAPATVEANIRASGLAGEGLVVRLLDSTDKTLEKQRLEIDSDLFEQKVRMQFRPTEPGFQLVNLRVLLAEDDVEGTEVDTRREVTLFNNSRLLAVDRGGGPFRILYVAGRPNWEFKFLRRALEEDVEIKLTALIRIAKEEPKFSFRDQAVETSNPLLAGFAEDETAEQYDEPVLLRIGCEEDELKTGFPTVEEELFAYQAIILDDVESSFFTQQQMLLMRKFVAERGGGLIMLGGQENFLGGGYSDTPIGDVLPVYVRGREKSAEKDQPVRYLLTREGSLEPWLRLRANQSDEQMRVRQMPDFKTWNTVADVKPGASVLAELDSSAGKQPGLSIQRFGKGRSAALLVGDMWRWSMRRATPETDDLAQSWRQIARWLTGDVPQRASASIDPPSTPLDPHRIAVSLNDAAFEPLDNAMLSLTVIEPDGKEVSTSAVPDADKPGLYQAEYWSKADGGYRIVIEASGPDGEILEPIETGWTAEPSAAEFADVNPNEQVLKRLAEKSGGEVVPVDQLGDFVQTLPSKKVPITESRVEPLWHRPWFVIFAIGCLVAEWGLRRWKGLP